MFPNAKCSELVSILATLDPVSQAAGTVTTGWLSVANFHALMAVLGTGVLGAAGTVDAKLQQALDAIGTGVMGGMLAGRIWQTFVPSRWTMNQKIRHLGSLCVLGLLAQNGAGWLGQAAPAWLALGQVGVVLASLAVGLGVSVAFPILLGTLVHAQPQQASRLSALTMIAICLGAALASQSIGLLADLWGMDSAFALLLLSALGYRLALRPLARVTDVSD